MEQYSGEYKHNQKDGEGVYIFENGDKYVGGFKNEKFDGYGELTTKDEIYKGQWKEGIF
jgi:hypothetical protein